MLWRWTVEQLPDGVVVLPQVAMTVGHGGRTQEAEADLVIVDPTFGVTIVEVKGGTVYYDASRAVWRREESGGGYVRDPVQQAKRARSILRTALRDAGIDTRQLPLRWAVAFPDARAEAPGAPVLDAAYLWDSTCIDRLADVFQRTRGQLDAQERAPGRQLSAKIVETLRGRTPAVAPALRISVERHEERVQVHTESHRNVLHHFTANRRVLVRGSAGTGKTALAIHAAARLAAMDERVLLACWNVVLAEELRHGLRAELEAMGSPRAGDVTEDPTGDVVVGHLVGLTRHAEIAVPERPDAGFYQERLPSALTRDVVGGTFDALVLDEAQDLSDLWMLALDDLVDDGGRWYAFADALPDLFASAASLPDFLELTHDLRENFRNSATFKGAERPVIVLGLDMDPDRPERAAEVGRAIYVAATRARSHLSVVGDPDVAKVYGFDRLEEQLRGAHRAEE
jgi:hypothetical protein